MSRPRPNASGFAAVLVTLSLAGCSGGDPQPKPDSTRAATGPARAAAATVDGLVDIGGGRRLYVRCTGTGTPTVLMEGGDDDTSDSFAFAEAEVAATTRTCVYDRANLGRSDPADGPRGLGDLTGDLEDLLAAAGVPGPLVLVGMSGGGSIAVGFAARHPDQVAGMVLVDVPPPFPDPPAELVAVLRWDSPENIEKRDYLQVERDAWAARTIIGDIPVTVISNKYSADEVAAAEFPEERPLLRKNVQRQRGWLVLSPRAKQVVVHTGHAVEEADPGLVRSAILEVVTAARS